MALDWDKRFPIVIKGSELQGISTFSDSSSGAKTPTFFGAVETVQDSKFGTGSGYFNGGTRVTFADHADWQFGGSGSGAGPFTLEVWVKFVTAPAVSTWDTILAQYVNASNYIIWGIYNNAGTYQLRLQQTVAGVTNIPLYITWSGITADTWYHVAVCRDGSNNYRAFIDGTQIGSTTLDADAISNFAAPLEIGTFNNINNLYGYLDELRISNNARYTSNFTAPSAAFTDDANTKLLMHFDPDKSVDLVDYPIGIRLSDSVGTGDRDMSEIFADLGDNKLKIAVADEDEDTQLPVEVSFWDSGVGLAVLWTKVPVVPCDADKTIYLYFDKYQADNTAYVGVTGSAIGATVWDGHFIDVWHLHETPAGAGSTLGAKRGINGSPQNTPVVASGLMGSAYDMEESESDYVIAPKASTCPDSSSSGHDPSSVGASIFWSTTNPASPVSGEGLCYFDNATRITFADHSDWQFGGGDGPFSVECWARWIALPTTTTWDMFCSQYQDASNQHYFGLYNNAGTYQLRFRQYVGGAETIGVLSTWAGIAINTWYHVAVSRDASNDYRLFVNGTQIGATQNDTTAIGAFTGPLDLGAMSTTHYLNGYMAEFRISDNARYTANFTPQTTPFDDDANTKLLLHFIPQHASVRSASKLTIEALSNFESHPGGAGLAPNIWYESTGTPTETRLSLLGYAPDITNLQFRGIFRDTSAVYTLIDPIYISPGTWYHLAEVVNSDTDQHAIFRDGQKSQGNPSATVPASAPHPVDGITIGRGPANNYDGLAEEVRLSKTARSESWINATYKTCFDTLLDVGTVEVLRMSVEFSETGGLEVSAHNLKMYLLALTVNFLSLTKVIKIAAYPPSIGIVSTIGTLGDFTVVARKPKSTWAGSAPSASASGSAPRSTWNSAGPSATWSTKKPYAIIIGVD
jgi:hypothetical protein